MSAFEKALSWLGDKGVVNTGQHPEELVWFANRVSSIVPQVYVEIGAREGVSFYTMSQAVPVGGLCIAIDWPESEWGRKGSKEQLEQVAKQIRMEGKEVIIIYGDSHKESMLHQLKEAVADRPIDVLFIDGDHTLEGVSNDYTMYGPLVRPDGIIGFHDIAKPSHGREIRVCEFWEDVIVGKSFEAMVRTPKDFGIGFIRTSV